MPKPTSSPAHGAAHACGDNQSIVTGIANLSGGRITLADLSQATDFSFGDGLLTIYGGPGDELLETVRVTGNTLGAGDLAVHLVDGQIQIAGQDTCLDGATLPLHGSSGHASDAGTYNPGGATGQPPDAGMTQASGDADGQPATDPGTELPSGTTDQPPTNTNTDASAGTMNDAGQQAGTEPGTGTPKNDATSPQSATDSHAGTGETEEIPTGSVTDPASGTAGSQDGSGAGPSGSNDTGSNPSQPVVQAAAIASDGLTGQPVAVAAQPYTGPVAGIEQQVVAISPKSVNVFALAPNLFIQTGDGADAIQGASGTNALDGGTGSSFLTSGSGVDSFFLDARGATADVWSTIVNLHAGGAVLLQGVTARTTAEWVDGQGAPGATGLTLHTTTANGVNASITLAGLSTADLASNRVTASFANNSLFVQAA